MSLSGMTVLVTGAGGIGVGAGVCDAIAEAGGMLILNDCVVERAKKVASRYRRAIALPGDVSIAGEVEAIFREAESRVERIHGLVNNAGIGLSRVAHEATEEQFDRLYAVDLRAVWLMSKAFAKHVIQRRETGSIVNISSVMATATIPRYALYSGAKAGVEGLTRGLAVELGPLKIRCNAVAPGYVHSEQNMDLIRTWTDDPAGWVRRQTCDQQALEYEISARDCGDAVAFFLSEASRCITGQVLRVDCGTTALLYNKDFVT